MPSWFSLCLRPVVCSEAAEVGLLSMQMLGCPLLPTALQHDDAELVNRLLETLVAICCEHEVCASGLMLVIRGHISGLFLR